MTMRATLSIAEAADVLGVSSRLVYNLVERGDLPVVMLGRRKLVPTRAIEMILEQAVDNFDPTRITGAPASAVDPSSAADSSASAPITEGLRSLRPSASRGAGSTGTAGALALLRRT